MTYYTSKLKSASRPLCLLQTRHRLSLAPSRLMTSSTSASYHGRKYRRSKSRRRHLLSNDGRPSRVDQPPPRRDSFIHRDSGCYERDKPPRASKGDCSSQNNINSSRHGSEQSTASLSINKRTKRGPLPTGSHQNQQITSPSKLPMPFVAL